MGFLFHFCHSLEKCALRSTERRAMTLYHAPGSYLQCIRVINVAFSYMLIELFFVENSFVFCQPIRDLKQIRYIPSIKR